MTKFGDALRRFRQAGNDPGRQNRRLSQERLGQLIGDALGDGGYTGAAISEWELGKSKPDAEDRKVLIALVRALQQCGSLKTPEEASRFLECGNYRALDEEEKLSLFPHGPSGNVSSPSRLLWFAELFSIPREDLDDLFAKAKDGPGPPWPRILAELMRKGSDRFSISIASILWMATGLLAVWLIGPSLRFPFESYNAAFHALVLYAAGSLILPLLIGGLIKTEESEYWNAKHEASSFWLRLYTYQGAGVGFNVGYFLVFPLSLMRSYLGFGPTVWIEILTVTVAVILGNMGARVVPHNLWLAYGRLALRDGWIFFVVALMGPLWAFFFLEFYSIILHPIWGSIVILLVLLVVVVMARRSSRK